MRKCVGISMLVIGFTLSAFAGSSINGTVKRFSISYSNNCAFFWISSGHQGWSQSPVWGGTGVYPDNQSRPEWGARWVIKDLDDQRSKNLISMLMIAKADGKSVNVYGTNNTSNADDFWSEVVEGIEFSDGEAGGTGW